MTTTHRYLEKYPITDDCEKLIIGTIHPHEHHKFKVQFFYGSELSIWSILNEVFHGELGDPISLDGILNFLRKHKIGVSDTIIECKRKNPTALDRDLIPQKLNENIIEQIRKSDVSEILFTSGFGKNNAFKLFYVDILKQKLTKDIRTNREIVLDNSFFGRPVKLTALYSPAGTSNVGLSKSKLFLANRSKYANLKHPVKSFKIDYYPEKFQ